MLKSRGALRCNPFFDRSKTNRLVRCEDFAPAPFTLRAVYPSTGSGRTACILLRPFLAPLALRLGSGGTRELAPTLFTLRQAQGERHATCQGPYLHRSPFDRLRGNGSALQGACSYAVHPSTGSGRTACNLPRPFLAPLAFRLGLGGTAVLCRELAPTLFTLRQAQGERLAFCQGPFLHRSPFARLRGNGSALQRACSYAVHPSTGSGRTVLHPPDVDCVS